MTEERVVEQPSNQDAGAGAVTAAGWPVYAQEQHIGRSRKRESLEDRMQVAEVTTAGGLTLLVAMVADGIGGGNYGERAAQLAIDTSFAVIAEARASNAGHIPRLLRLALTRANAAVYQEAQEGKRVRGMGSTATVAAIHENKLYVANAGDSRAYLIRDGKVIQLTRDHTWAYEMVRLGRLAPARANAHPKANELTRSLGYEGDVAVDAGLFLSKDEDEESARRNQGLALRAGDRLVLCSDGLIKERHNAPGHYVEENELLKTVTRYGPDKAAQELLRLALDRGVDDNVTVIVMEMPGSKRAFYVPRWVWFGAAGAAGLFLVLLLAFLLFRPRDAGDATTAVAEVALAGEATDTVTPRPTALPCTAAVFAAGQGALGKWGDNPPAAIARGSDIPIGTGSSVQSGAGVLELVLSDGTQLFVERDSELELEQVAGCADAAETRLVLRQGKLLAELAGAQGHLLAIENALGGWAGVRDGVMGLSYSNVSTLFEMDCFRGPCSMKDIGGERTYATGEGARMDSNGVPSEPVALRSAQFCTLAAHLVPCPTATPTGAPTETPSATFTPQPPTRARPTSTPRPTATATPRPQFTLTSTPPLPNNTPEPGATATSPPAATSTPRPVETATSPPPATSTTLPTSVLPSPTAAILLTATPVPPTSTPEPPPPTSTPEPPRPTKTPKPPPTNTSEPPTVTPGIGG